MGFVWVKCVTFINMTFLLISSEVIMSFLRGGLRCDLVVKAAIKDCFLTKHCLRSYKVGFVQPFPVFDGLREVDKIVLSLLHPIKVLVSCAVLTTCVGGEEISPFVGFRVTLRGISL